MKNNSFATVAAAVAAVIAIAMFVYLVRISRATSYLSDDPKACINCHVMNAQYASWRHSAHARYATCVDCHLPSGQALATYAAKASDGLHHALAFTMNQFGQRIQISEAGKTRVQTNCIACHAKVVDTMLTNRDRFHNFTNPQASAEVLCWDCHRDTPHGRVRNLASTPYNLDVRALK
ncbi:MAG: cytochrome c nitrite reductase small subunit [Desulfobulbaceae bacterium]|jgi:cytochrome c nitrite reductase small subunit|nr:cytochrome c nitrite reductase small subunit [Desulfobulbaceae bacterium]